jgi:hypothetical protein
LLLSGKFLRDRLAPKLMRFYFGLFLLSVPVFLYSPSLLFYFVSGNINEYKSPIEFYLAENLYAVEQQSMLASDQSQIEFKIIRKFGIYNKTLSRNINFGKHVVKINLLSLNDDSISIRGYYLDGASLDLHLKTGLQKNSITVNHAN